MEQSRRQRTRGFASSCASSAPRADGEWAGLCAQARLYLAAGAWRSAHDLLDPHLDSSLRTASLPAGAVEALCLRLAACARLGHEDHVAAGCARLREVERDARSFPPEAQVLLVHALAGEDVRAGRYADADARFMALPEDVLAATSACTRARMALLHGHLAAVQGAEREAEQHGLAAAELAATAGSEALRGDAYALLAIIARRRGALAEANSLYARASQSYWQSGNLSGHAVVLLNRAWAVGLIGLLPQSAELFREALHHAGALGRATTALRARLGLGWLAVRGGELDVARARLLSAWREARRTRSLREEALALEYLSDAYLLRGNRLRAKLALERASRLAEQLAPEGDLALEVRIRRALLALAEGDGAACLKHAREALGRARRAGMRWEEAQALRIEAQALAAAGNRREARSRLRHALVILESMGEQLERRLVEAWLQALEQKGPAPAQPIDAAAGADANAVRFWLSHPLLAPGRAIRSRAPAVRRVASARELAGELDPVWRSIGLVTRSGAFRETLRQVETLARGSIPALVLGETGTGKDLVAQGIHALSQLPGRFVAVNCAAARRELFIAELFGARRGAYTGAVSDRAGLIDEAERGTLFLDEIADLEPEAQGFLLRFLDSGEVRALGDTRSRRIEARVVAATCIDLAERVASGRFRPDLYGRLAGLVVRIPPLRERPEDIDLLAFALWEREGGDPEDARAVFSSDLLAALRAGAWPGNVRELRHSVSRTLLFTQTHGPAAARAHLLEWCASLPLASPHAGPYRAPGSELASVLPRPPGGQVQRTWDAELLRRTLEESNGRVALAARRLGVSRSHAYRLYKRLADADAA
jgi:two-component system NtrC family response regulator